MIAFLCCLSLVARAGGDADFITLDWDEIGLDTIAPEFRRTQVLQRGGAWQVTMEYPEYELLTENEERLVARYADLIGEDIRVESEVYEVRGQWRLTWHCLPLIRRDGRIQRLLSARFTLKRSQARVAAVTASASERYTSRSAMTSGRWVKISITEDGMYRLTPAFLQKAGFTDISRVRLYGYGGHVQSTSLNADTDMDDLPEIPLYSASDGSLLFWGNGLVSWNGTKRLLNTYAREACYFLSDVAPDGGTGAASRIATVPAGTASASTVSSAMRHRLIEKDEYAMYHVGNRLVSADNYADGAERSYTFSGINASGTVQLTYSFASAGLTNTNILTWSVNSGAARTVQIRASDTQYQYAVWREATTDVTSSSTGSGSWTVKMHSRAGIEAHLDYLALHYMSPLSLESGFTFFSATNANVRYTGLSGASALRVMRLAKRGSAPVLVPTDGTDVVVPTGGFDYVGFDANYAFPEPTLVGEVANQNLHGWGNVDMVIILPQNCSYSDEAERLAAAHRQYDGMSVSLVWVHQIYNEFSSGTPDATALRRFAKMLYDRGADSNHRLKYLLLMADGAWDNRMLSTAWASYDRSLYLPCMESDESGHAVSSYVCDDYYGMTGDATASAITSLPINVAVGRFPVTTVDQARQMVDKSVRHISLANAGAWKNTAVFLGDDDAIASDYAAEMKGADQAANAALFPDGADGVGLSVNKVMFDSYVRATGISGSTYPEVAKLINRFQTDGALLMNYTGHANSHTLSHESVVRLKDVKAWKSDNLPLWFTAACDVAPWDGQEENIGEAAMLNAQGGAVAFIGTARTVYSSPNHRLNTAFTGYLFDTDETGRRNAAGWALAEAKNDNMSVNSINYSYLGDPALVFGAPLQRVVLETVNGQTPSTDVQVKSSSKLVLKGHIEDAAGKKMSGFNGSLTVTLLDAMQTVTCLRNITTSSYTYKYRDYNTILSRRTATVKDGDWTVNMITPKDILFADSSGRLVFYALNEERTVEAAGASTDFTVGGVGDDFSDLTEGPDLFIYLNTEDFRDGGTVNATPYFYAHMTDTVDIAYLGNSVGHNLLLTIDNDPLQSYVLDDWFVPDGDDYTRGTVAYNLPTMANGAHSLVFEAWNNQNLYSRRSLRFVVDNELKPDPISVAVSPNPASSMTNLIISHRFPGSETYYEVRIFDLYGRLVWMKAETAVPDGKGAHVVPWDLTNGSGGKVSSGLYPFRVTVRSGEGEEVYEGQKIIVLNNN